MSDSFDIDNSFFLKNASNVFSQAGDDGVIEAILNYFGINSGICCEFGAADGLANANTANLWRIKKDRWKALLIEPREEVKTDLINNTKDYSNVKICFDSINRNNIDSVISENLPNGDFVLLSIDIDGDDLGVFEAMTLKPKIIVIESTNIYGDSDTTTHIGASPRAIVRVAKGKGYIPVASTGNIYLVHSSMSSIKPIPEITNLSCLLLDNSRISTLHSLPKMNGIK